MTTPSTSRMVLLAFAAGCCIALVFAIQHFRRDLPVDPKAATAAPAVPKPASGAQDQGPDRATVDRLNPYARRRVGEGGCRDCRLFEAIAAAQAKADAVAGALTALPDSDDGVPTFDVARIEPTGEAVIAGRATPGATVELLRNGELHDRAVADQSGQFLMVPPRFPSGTYDLTLRSRQPEGKQATSRQSVTVTIEPIPTDRPVVALMTPGKPTVVLSQPPAPKPLADTVVVESVEIEPGGKFHASGRARAGAAVRLYLNDTFVTSVTAGTDGRFVVTINEGVAPGSYRVRLDEAEHNSGAVRARAEVPFIVPDTMAVPSVLKQAKAASKTPDIAASGQPQLGAAVATVLPDGGSPSTVVVPKMATAEPLIDESEFKERIDCLYREVGRLNETHAIRGTALDDLSKTAADLCSEKIRTRLMRASSSIASGEHAVKYDRWQTELRASAIARELVEYGARK